MEALYYPELKTDTTQIELSGDEFKHAKALRLGVGEKCLIINGTGLAAEVGLVSFSKKSCLFSVLKLLPNFGEPKFETTLALGLLAARDRMEFALEKAVELGATEFVPLLCARSQSDKFRRERFEAKALAAAKQCLRSKIPKISSPKKPKVILKENFDKIVLADVSGEKFDSAVGSKNLLLVGPEGGFTDEEIRLFLEDPRCEKVKLNERRLRAETAAAALCALVASRGL